MTAFLLRCLLSRSKFGLSELPAQERLGISLRLELLGLFHYGKTILVVPTVRLTHCKLQGPEHAVALLPADSLHSHNLT